MDRRAFLQGLAASPMIFGLPELFSQDEKRPAWLTAAIKRMKETKRCALVIVAPAEEEARVALGEQLLALVESKDASLKALAAECVAVCLRRELATKSFGEIDAKENAIVLDADAKRVTTGTITKEALEKPETAVAAASLLLHGSDGSRLRAAVEKVRAGLDDADAVAKAIDAVDCEEAAPAEAMALLRKRADRIAPWLAFATLDAVYKPARERYRGLLLELADRAEPDKASGLRLPYGAKLKGSAKRVPAGDPCPACGMAIVEPESKRFLDFLVE
jgi:hypothetical protein